MISAKNIYNSRAYRQLKAYAKGDKALLERLVQEYIFNYNDYGTNRNKEKFNNMTCLSGSFVWESTIQGHKYWSDIEYGD